MVVTDETDQGRPVVQSPSERSLGNSSNPIPPEDEDVPTSNSGLHEPGFTSVNVNSPPRQPTHPFTRPQPEAGIPEGEATETENDQTDIPPQSRSMLMTYLSYLCDSIREPAIGFLSELRYSAALQVLLVICIARGIYEYGLRVFGLITLHVIFMCVNQLLVREVAKGANRSLLALIIAAASSMTGVAGTIYLLRHSRFYYVLLYIGHLDEYFANFWNFIWSIALVDYMAKLITVLIKVGVALIPGAFLSHRRGKLYQLIEYSSQVYRCSLPMIPWAWYVVNIGDTYESFSMCSTFVGLYFGLKMRDVYEVMKNWWMTISRLVKEAQYGCKPTEEEIQAAGDSCSICQSEFVNPVRLECAHIFCEDCVGTWFERKRTCPICRTEIFGDSAFKDGSTCPRIQLL